MLLCELFQNKTLSPEFYAWFGDSKAVNADGSPMILYHGTSKDQDFKHFNIPKSGAWFATTPKGASDYAVENDSQNLVYDHGTGKFIHKHTASRVIPVYLKINNPKVYEGYPQEEVGTTQNYKKASGILFDKLRAEGHDSIIITHQDKPMVVALLVNDPSRIKSAISNKDYTHKKNIHEAEEFVTQPPITDNLKFRKWFGQSKVVDNSGKPLVVYHGGRKGIKIFGDNYKETLEWAASTGFKLSEIERLTYENPVHFFTDDPYIAQDYADQHDREKQETYEVYLRIERPIDLRPGISGKDNVSKLLTALLQAPFEFDSGLNSRQLDLTVSHTVRKLHHLLKGRSLAMGHDGIIMPDTCVRDRSMHTSYVVFDSNQIKTVTNKRFSKSQNIHESIGAQPKYLYHATKQSNIDSIMQNGLQTKYYGAVHGSMDIHPPLPAIYLSRKPASDNLNSNMWTEPAVVLKIDFAQLDTDQMWPDDFIYDAFANEEILTTPNSVMKALGVDKATAIDIFEQLTNASDEQLPELLKPFWFWYLTHRKGGEVAYTADIPPTAIVGQRPHPFNSQLTESIEIVHDRFRNEDDDDYVYHVTLEPLAQRILQQGFMPNRRPTMTNYAGYSKGKVFFTERSGVSFWEERVEQHAENNMDDPPPVAVLRVPKEEIGSLLQPDPVGTRDSHASCYFITEPFKPTN